LSCLSILTRATCSQRFFLTKDFRIEYKIPRRKAQILSICIYI
jgi:hypothetical protein